MCYDIREGSEEDLQAAVAIHGPISICMDAGTTEFAFYK